MRDIHAALEYRPSRRRGPRPENTLRGVRRMRSRWDADGAELDVQLTTRRRSRRLPRQSPEARYLPRRERRMADAARAQDPRSHIGGIATYDVGRARAGKRVRARASRSRRRSTASACRCLSDVVEIAGRATKPFHLFVELKTSFADRSLSAPPEKLAEATLALLKATTISTARARRLRLAGLLHAKKIEPAHAHAGSRRWRKAGFATARRRRKTIRRPSRRSRCCATGRARARRPGQAASTP